MAERLIRTLDDLLARERAGAPPTRDEIEQVLTGGYGHALELEVQRLQVARELAQREGVERDAWRAQLAHVTAELTALRTRLGAAGMHYGRNPLSSPRP